MAIQTPGEAAVPKAMYTSFQKSPQTIDQESLRAGALTFYLHL